VEVPRNASRVQIERPHQSGGNSADLVVSQGELRRIHLPRTSVNRGKKTEGQASTFGPSEEQEV
jgi:hypothetical protein